MSKLMTAPSRGAVKSSALGGGAALVVYVLLQLVYALLIDREVVGLELLYPMVCGAAAVAAFAGCLCCVLLRGERSVLSLSGVVAVFLTLTLAAALLTADAVALEGGLAGVGLGMVAGGLLAAILTPAGSRGGRTKRRGRTGKRRR